MNRNAILLVIPCFFLGGQFLAAQEVESDSSTLVSQDRSSITLKAGYTFTKAKTLSESLPFKASAEIAGPIISNSRREGKSVQIGMEVVCYSGISLLEQWRLEDGSVPDETIAPETIQMQVAESEKNRLLELDRKRGIEAKKVTASWIELAGRKTRLISIDTSVSLRPGVTYSTYLRVVVIRVKDSFYTFTCVSINGRSNGWASAIIEKIVDSSE